MTLAAYITANFSQVKSQLGWSDSLQIVAITDKALEWYGVVHRSRGDQYQEVTRNR
jgi:hypothetical protein